MHEVTWQEHVLATPNVDLVWYEAGSGPTVIFLHGGPGYTHQLMRPFVAPLTQQFRCVLYDQRGSGRSTLDQLDATTLHVDRFIEDLDALREELGLEQVRLVGWSWGAILALTYALAHPQQTERVALVAPGPIPPETIDVHRANMLWPLTADERAEVAQLFQQGEAARDANDQQAYNALYQQRMQRMFRAWFYDPAKAEQHFAEFTHSFDPFQMAQIEPHVLASLPTFRSWTNFNLVEMPVLVLYGYQDFQPITQAYTLQQWMVQSQFHIRMINECGHLPWIEQPDLLYHELEPFLHGQLTEAASERVTDDDAIAQDTQAREA